MSQISEVLCTCTYIDRSINIRILAVFSRILPAPADLLLAAVTVHLLYICCTSAAIVRVVIQPDGGSPAPGPVDPFQILINRKALESIRSLSEKNRRIVIEKLKTLQEDPYPGSGGDKECLHVHGREDTHRHCISRTFTAFYRTHEPEKEVHVLAVMSTEQAHKWYGWF